MIDVMAKDAEVQATARAYLPWMIAMPLLLLGLVMFDGIFIGATRTADMRNMMAVSAAIYFAAVWMLMDPFGNHGLWLALAIANVARGVTLALRYPALESAASRET
jgi:MATE family multidrug resistance protein